MKKMKIKWILSILALIFTISIIVFIVYQNKQAKPPQKETPDVKQELIQQNYNFIIKSYQKQIALFVKNEEDPKEIYDIFLENLPQKDVDRLNKGIYAKTEEEAYLMLEDYR